MKGLTKILLSATIIILSTYFVNAQATLDTTIVENDKIVCYRSNTPGYGNYLPPVITDYIRIISGVSENSTESPKQKKVRIAKYLNEFSVEESKNADKERFLGYVAHLLICDPYKTPLYRDMYLEKVIEINKNSKESLQQQATIVQNLIHDYMKLQHN